MPPWTNNRLQQRYNDAKAKHHYLKIRDNAGGSQLGKLQEAVDVQHTKVVTWERLPRTRSQGQMQVAHVLLLSSEWAAGCPWSSKLAPRLSGFCVCHQCAEKLISLHHVQSLEQSERIKATRKYSPGKILQREFQEGCQDS